MDFREVKRVSVSDQVFDQLKEQIFNEQWKPGDQLPSENDLSAAMGVSRTTVRSAVQKLVALGLLETRFGEGTFVRAFSPGVLMNGMIPAMYLNENTLIEVMEFRYFIEGPVARSACAHANNADIESLDAIYERMKKSRNHARDFSRADFDFHREIGRIANNSLIAQTYRILEDILKMAMERVVDYRGNERGLYYHGLLLKAFRAHDFESCGRIMTEHVGETYDNILDTVGKDSPTGKARP
ncbi:MAG: FadR family transcriptional regulator [Oscillospiraceae bacterium]|jgi:GntR family transcriptional repressor for pyruvate dehydrogenase complex|nr:FadR family transcriptional regulator [Oscillospiraceae bacterium]